MSTPLPDGPDPVDWEHDGWDPGDWKPAELSQVRPEPVTRSALAIHSRSASPIGVLGGPCMNGQISSAMPRQSPLAPISASIAVIPRLIRCKIT